MNLRTALLIASLLLAAVAAPLDADTLAKPNWTRPAALAVADTPQTTETLSELFRLAREGRSDELLEKVRAIAGAGYLPDPERDRILHELAMALGDFEPGVVAPDVLDFLAGTRSRTLVPHDDHPESGVPLFNIRAAAAGSLAKWSRLENPGLADPAGAAKDPYGDIDSFIEHLSLGPADSLADRVRTAGSLFTPAEREVIVAAAAGLTDSGTASLVLAEITPDLLGRPAVDDLLFDLLDHRELGATAALVLGGSGDGAILARLADLASQNEGLAPKRASLAIGLHLARESER